MKIVSDLELNGNQIKDFRLDNVSGIYDSQTARVAQIWFNTEKNIIQYINNKKQIIDILDANNLNEMSDILPKFDLSSTRFSNDVNNALLQGIYTVSTAEETLNLPSNFNINSSITLLSFLDNNKVLIHLLIDTLLNKMWFRSVFTNTEENEYSSWVGISLEGHLHSSLPNLTITDTTPSLSTQTGALLVKGGVGIEGNITASGISGAIWNDYAEFRQTIHNEEITPGLCVVENGDGRVRLSTRRLEVLPMIVSDTYGFSIGKIHNIDVPVAVSGRVLAYTDKPVNTFKVGDWVCSGENGKISKMRPFERLLFPDRRVGLVSAIPEGKYWGTGQVDTTDRVWIKV